MNATVPPSRRGSRGGFTLVEVVVALAIMGIIASAISSVVVLASRALPSASGANESTIAATAAMEQLTSELRTALSVTEATATAVTFTVPDRTGDEVAETIRYSWAGAGSPLVRKYNSDGATDVTGSLYALTLTYTKRKVTTNSGTTTTTVDSAEQLLASFTGWTGITPTVSTSGLSATSWASEAFSVGYTFPDDTTRWSITRVSLRVAKSFASSASVVVSVCQPVSTGSPIAGTPVGTSATIASTRLGTGPTWQDATFSDVHFTDRNQKNFVLLLKASGGAAQVEYYSSASAPTDSTTFLWSTDSGGSWLPSASSRPRNDARFFVYGTYRQQTQTSVTLDTYHLGSVNITVQPTASANTRVDGGIALMNQPQVPGP